VVAFDIIKNGQGNFKFTIHVLHKSAEPCGTVVNVLVACIYLNSYPTVKMTEY